MNLSELQDYGNWIGKSPREIRKHVIRVGGWTKVFPKELPEWAHRLRQAFNEPPIKLMRVRKHEAVQAIERAKRLRGSTYEKFLTSHAYSGDVYLETKGGKSRHWIEMSKQGSEFHYEEQWAFWQTTFYPRSLIGVFKMISVDGTGGSMETALHNWADNEDGGKTHAGKVGQWIYAKNLARLNEKYLGSYNYADTMQVGKSHHERLDEEPDKRWGPNYISEGRKGMFSPMARRKFKDFPSIRSSWKKAS